MQRKMFPALICCGLLATLTPLAAQVSTATTKEQVEAQYEEAKTRLKADHQAAKTWCNSRAGGERQVCRSNAESKYEAALKEERARRDSELASLPK